MRNPKVLLFKAIAMCMVLAVSITTVITPSYAQSLSLPTPGSFVGTTQAFEPMMIKGINIYFDNPLKFDFIISAQNEAPSMDEAFEDESQKLIKYFLAALTIPEEDLWVNLSPHEPDHIIPNAFARTEMGRDLLAQDYLLKQLTSSLIHPDHETGQSLWNQIYTKLFDELGTTDVPVDILNKVWIVPEKADVYEHAHGALVLDKHLKVELDKDHVNSPSHSSSVTEAMKSVIIPVIEKEVNKGAHFANLRQIYNALILATWYKRALKSSLLTQVYAGQNKVQGLKAEHLTTDEIYNQYLQAFKQGVYEFIKEDYDPILQETIPRKYFSGGLVLSPVDRAMQTFGAGNLGQVNSAKVIAPPVALNATSYDFAVTAAFDNAMESNDSKNDVGTDVVSKTRFAGTTWDNVRLFHARVENLVTPRVEQEAQHKRAHPASFRLQPDDIFYDISGKPIPTYQKQDDLSNDDGEQVGLPINATGPVSSLDPIPSDLPWAGPQFGVKEMYYRYHIRSGRLQILLNHGADGISEIPSMDIEQEGNVMQEEPEDALDRLAVQKIGDIPDEARIKKRRRELFRGEDTGNPNYNSYRWPEHIVYATEMQHSEGESINFKPEDENTWATLWVDAEIILSEQSLREGQHELVQRLIDERKLPLVSKAFRDSQQEVTLSPIVRQYDRGEGGLDFEAETADEYMRNVPSDGQREVYGSLGENLELGIKGYMRSHLWRSYPGEDGEFPSTFFQGKDTYEALEENGFFDVEHSAYFLNYIVRPFIRAINSSGEAVPVNLEVDPKKQKEGDKEVLEQTLNLCKSLVKETLRRNETGRQALPGVEPSPTRDFLLKLATSKIAEEYVSTGFSVGLTAVITVLFGTPDALSDPEFLKDWNPWIASTIQFLALTGMFLGEAGFMYFIGKWAIEPGLEKLKKAARRYRDKKFQKALQDKKTEGKTSEQKHEENFQVMKERLDTLDPEGCRALCSGLDEVKIVLLKGLEEEDRYKHASNIGRNLVFSKFEANAPMVAVSMLKKLADENNAYFKEVEKDWQKRSDNEPELKPLLELIPLVEALQDKKFIEAEVNRRSRVNGTGDNHLLEVRQRAIRRNMLARERSRLDRNFVMDDFLTRLRGDTFSPEQREILIGAMFADIADFLSFNQLMAKRGVAINAEEARRWDYLAVLFPQLLASLPGEKQTLEDFKLTNNDVKNMTEELDAARIKSAHEEFVHGLLENMDPDLFKLMGNTLRESGAIALKNTPGTGVVNLAPFREETRVLYRVYQRLTDVNAEYARAIARVNREAFVESFGGRADPQSPAFKTSHMIPLQYFDESQHPVFAKQLKNGLAVINAFGGINDKVRVVLGLVFHPGYKPEPERRFAGRLTIFDFQCTQNYLATETYDDESAAIEKLKQELRPYLKLGRVGPAEDLPASIERFLDEQVQIIQERKSSIRDQERINFNALSELEDALDTVMHPGVISEQEHEEFNLRAGAHEQESHDYLKRLYQGALAILSNQSLFEEFSGDFSVEEYWQRHQSEMPTNRQGFFAPFGESLSNEEQATALKSRYLLQAIFTQWSLDDTSTSAESPSNRTFDWFASQDQQLITAWNMVRNHIIKDKGLGNSREFKDVILFLDRAKENQRHGRPGSLGDVIKTSTGEADHAIASEIQSGGVDFNPAELKLNVHYEGDRAMMATSPELLERIQNAPGLVPMILNVVPLGPQHLPFMSYSSPKSSDQLSKL